MTNQNVRYDLGCGEGDVLIEAATTHSTQCGGLDIDPTLVAQAKMKAVKAGVHQKVHSLRETLNSLQI